MSYEINLRLRRFGPRTVHPTGLNGTYIGLQVPYAPRGSTTYRPRGYINTGKLHGPEGISDGTITMDLGAIVCFMTDRRARGPD